MKVNVMDSAIGRVLRESSPLPVTTQTSLRVVFRSQGRSPFHVTSATGTMTLVQVLFLALSLPHR